jgi:hypothetical protein
MKKKIVLFALVVVSFLIWIVNRRSVGMDLTPLKQFAVSTIPCAKEFQLEGEKEKFTVICRHPPQPSDTVISILNRSEINDDYKKYVLLIFLKLYYQQVIRYNQSFEVRDSPFILQRFRKKSALTRALCEITGKSFLERKLGPEFLPAYKVIEYLDENPYLKQDENIKRQLAMIDSLKLNRNQ